MLVFPDAETAARERGAGEVWLLDASGRPVARLLPYQWIPAGAPWLNFEEAVRRSGIAALFKACGIPVERTTQDRADAPRVPWWQKLTLLLSPGPFPCGTRHCASRWAACGSWRSRCCSSPRRACPG
ncbi:hypothetical protein ACFQVA_16165 [Actinomadura keratinilytica]